MRTQRALSFGNLKLYEQANEEYLKTSADKPIHRPVQSLLASGSGFENFRGIINLGGFMLVLLTSRLALENIIKYGIVVDPFLWLRYILHSPYKFTALFSIVYCNAFILCALFIERALISGRLKESSTLMAHCINLASTLLFPAAVILFSDFNPFFSVTVLTVYTVVFLKLWSYAAVNRWCRQALRSRSNNRANLSSRKAVKTLRSVSMDFSTDFSASANRPMEAGGDEAGKEEAVVSESPRAEAEPETIPNDDSGDGDGTRFRRLDRLASGSGSSSAHGDESPPAGRAAVPAAGVSPAKSPAPKARSQSHEGTRQGCQLSTATADHTDLLQYVSLTDIMEKEPQTLLSPSLHTTEFWGYLHQQYPENVHLVDLYYFMMVPSLCYELNFPRTVSVRRLFVLKRLFELVFLTQLMLCLVQQWVVPILQNSLAPIRMLSPSQVIERCLKLAIPNHLIWLMGFYAMFHSFLNLAGELTYFGDRFFYSDWWNSDSVAAFWSKWNIPVHRFCRRHIYVPLLTQGWTRKQASLMVFLISAVLHEFLVSVPLKMPRMWAFLGMLSQMPYALLVHYLFPRGGIWGNIAVWITLIIGQPMAILFYFHDYYLAHYSV